MLEEFLSYIVGHLSISCEDKILLAISGGIDSMVMLDLFIRAKHPIAVAHVNHSTRQGASKSDMDFVKSYCQKRNIDFYSTTLSYTELNTGNFQENARLARYAFFNSIVKAQDFQYIATAHHQDDRLETFIMHLNRKSGIQGLTSLKANQKNRIRPLLFLTKKEIELYATINKIEFSVDSSNLETNYTRNQIRHEVITPLKKVFPDIVINANTSISHLDNLSNLLEELILGTELISTQKERIIIDRTKLLSFVNKEELLYQIISRYNFDKTACTNMLLTAQTGAYFTSDSHEAIYDRQKIIIRPKESNSEVDFQVDCIGKYEISENKVLIVKEENSSTEDCLNPELIKWPLSVRKIKPGDKMKLKGMNGKSKSIKKICTDLKINRFDKEGLIVVIQNDEIINLIGHKIAAPYSTKQGIKFAIL